VNINDCQNDPVLAAIAALPTYDVSERHTRRSRSRCHALLQARSRRDTPVVLVSGTPFRRVIGPALVAAWCVAYLVEVIRRAAAFYGL